MLNPSWSYKFSTPDGLGEKQARGKGILWNFVPPPFFSPNCYLGGSVAPKIQIKRVIFVINPRGIFCLVNVDAGRWNQSDFFLCFFSCAGWNTFCILDCHPNSSKSASKKLFFVWNISLFQSFLGFAESDFMNFLPTPKKMRSPSGVGSRYRYRYPCTKSWQRPYLWYFKISATIAVWSMTSNLHQVRISPITLVTWSFCPKISRNCWRFLVKSKTWGFKWQTTILFHVIFYFFIDFAGTLCFPSALFFFATLVQLAPNVMPFSTKVIWPKIWRCCQTRWAVSTWSCTTWSPKGRGRTYVPLTNRALPTSWTAQPKSW